jgi:hypothetical protein
MQKVLSRRLFRLSDEAWSAAWRIFRATSRVNRGSTIERRSRPSELRAMIYLAWLESAPPPKPATHIPNPHRPSGTGPRAAPLGG